jgi:hypothetical protein
VKYFNIKSLICCLLCCICTAFGELLYDIDFSSPIHTVGQQMTIGAGSIPSRTASRNNFGEQIVISSCYGLTEQPVKLVPGDTPLVDRDYSQFQLSMSEFSYPSYKLDFDVCISGMSSGWDGFTLLFDVPTVVRLHFSNNGYIIENDSRRDNIIRAYESQELLSMSVLVDIPTNTWSISCNSEHLYEGQFFYTYPAHPEPPEYVNSIRFNLCDDLGTHTVPVVCMDNIRVFGVPEPATVVFLMLGSVLVKGRRRR